MPWADADRESLANWTRNGVLLIAIYGEQKCSTRAKWSTVMLVMIHEEIYNNTLDRLEGSADSFTYIAVDGEC